MTSTGNGGLFSLNNAGVITGTIQNSVISRSVAQTNGGIGYIVTSSAVVTFTLNLVTISYSRVNINDGGSFYVSSSIGLSTINMDYVEVTDTKSGTSGGGGFLYVGGISTTITSTNGITIYQASARGGTGGVFKLANTNVATLNVDQITVDTSSASTHGGYLSFSGTTLNY